MNGVTMHLRWSVAAFALLAGLSAQAEVKMPAIFGDHMVLQGSKTIPVWGMASPGEAVKVTLGKESAKTVADAQGKWRVDLKPLKANGVATTMMVKGTNELTFTDVLVGDVWVASGQSNMEFGIKQANTGVEAVKAANHPMIRLFTVPRITAAYPQADILAKHPEWQGKWLVCSPETLLPEGSNGFSAVAYFFGVKIQAFTGNPVGLIHTSWGGTPAEAWVSIDGLKKVPELAEFVTKHETLQKGYDAAVTALPQTTAEYQEKHAAWVRDAKAGNDAKMKEWNAQANAAEAAGQPAPPRPTLVPEPQLADPAGGPGHPTSLYNGMIAPLVPYAIKGAIWYQGEANGGRGMQYRALLPALIKDWRADWHDEDISFLYVQLPDFNAGWGLLREAQSMTLSVPKTGMPVIIDLGTLKNIHPPFKEPVGDRLALVGEHVAYGKNFTYTGPAYKSMKVNGAEVTVSFDHVGTGLAILPRPISGPDVVPAPTDKLLTFTVAGDDKKFHVAEARIVGNTVVLSSAEVPHPVAVRYGWEPPPVCNLYNKEGLAASPFRTDDWQ